MQRRSQEIKAGEDWGKICPHDFTEREASVETEGYCPICMAERIKELTAAAEVGEPEPHDVKNARNQAALIKAIEEINSLSRELAATIEHCAQVAIDWRGWFPGNREPKPEEIAAAIRALKDNPCGTIGS